ncbi:MAG: Stk1 family PASTA domain-containing Ser/Thr kinase [Lachnospiraceae bacterium]|nr:Stk1 family PASTA domain-containing Ser/Thr kinase [Lachnospiraceae bacterium]
MNRYEIIERIGSGGMADVYKARDTALNRFVAVKVLKNEFSSDETFVKRFRAEAQSAGGLSHPNIVGVYDVGEESGTYFIVMELVEGITLKNYIEMKGRLSIPEALNISVQVASGLSAAHEKRIIHRDIKPQNIIISRDSKVKVTDFGIAKMADSTTVTTTAAGTVHYISPEQARGGYSDEKSDIYSLGITMYEMVTGRVPFDGETNVAIALLHIQGEMTPPREIEPSIPKSFEKIILKCTQKKPEYRYNDAKELIGDLRRVLTNPEGEYVVLGSAAAAMGNTIVMGEKEIAELEARRKGTETVTKESEPEKASVVTASEKNARTSGSKTSERAAQKKGEVRKTGRRNVSADTTDTFIGVGGGNNQNPTTRMILGFAVVAFVILVILLIFIIGHATGFLDGGIFNGGGKETQTESVAPWTETQPATVEVPDMLGMTESQARTALSEAKLGVKVVSGTSDDYDEGQVYEQDPAPNTDAELHTQVTIYVSKGRSSIEIDDLKGMDYKQAKDLLESMGLTVKLEFEESDDSMKDLVLRTSPDSGEIVSAGDDVTIYVGKGKQKVYVKMPDLKGKTLDEAIEAIEELGLTYNGKSSQYSDDYAVNVVMDQYPTQGETIEEGTSVTLTVSLGPLITEYNATINVLDYFGKEVIDEHGDAQVYEYGKVTIIVDHAGTEETVYDDYADSDSLPKTIAVTSETPGMGTVYEYLQGILIGSWTIDFR